MASIINFKPLQDNLLFSINLCKCSSAPPIFRFQFSSDVVTFSPSKHTRRPRLFSLTKVRAHVTRMETQSSTLDQELSHSTVNVTGNQIISGLSSLGVEGERLRKKSVRRTNLTSVVEKDVEGRFLTKNRRADKRLNSEQRREMDSWNANLARNRSKTEVDNVIRGRISKISEKGDGNQLGVKNMKKGAKKNKDNSTGTLLRIGLDICSKRGDVLGAIKLYELALKESIKMGQYHYAVLLYLCSSAATGVVQPAKSGSGNRSLTTVDSSNDFSVVSSSNFIEVENVGKRNFRSALNMQVSDMENLNGYCKNHENPVKNGFNSNGYAAGVPEDGPDSGVYEKEDITQFLNGYIETPPRSLDEVIGLMQHGHKLSTKDTSINHEGYGILVTEDVKKYALEKGFEIYEKMRLEEVPMNEATFTSVARMAMSIGDGDMAFEIVKQMKTLGINPRMRSYGPALSVFCNNGDIEKAFIVEKHMLEHGVSPEEPELEALLRVSVEARRSDKVYYLLHKLRTSVRKVSPSTADLIEKWFKSGTASRVGKRKWDPELIKDAIGTGGGGWHGQGWLGKGKWTVLHTSVGADGFCKCCNEKLATIDLDPIETEKFAESVASIARQRERNSSFQKFQKWLDYYGPFEAVVDGANVGLFSQRRFKPSKVNAVVNGIRQMLPSKKYPLVILHNRRITGDKMDEPFNRTLIEKWKNADALYATPTGSNDDWYWLYAAIKFKCLLVTNDEMRDHLFQLLGNDFFPKWKERHQVHFSFSDVGPVFRMPPPCSVVIQESEKGRWHIPVETECDYEGERMWLCITRGASQRDREDSTWALQESPPSSHEDGLASVDARSRFQINLESWKNNHEAPNHAPQGNFRNLKHIFSSSLRPNHHTIRQDIEAAEKFGRCVIEFQI